MKSQYFPETFLLLVFLLPVVLLFSILLCGCAPKDNRTTIEFASWGSKSEIDILKPILTDFEKENPNIKVNFMHIPQNYFQKIHLLFASNTAPDVIFINNLYLPIYANANLLEELTMKLCLGKGNYMPYQEMFPI